MIKKWKINSKKIFILIKLNLFIYNYFLSIFFIKTRIDARILVTTLPSTPISPWFNKQAHQIPGIDPPQKDIPTASFPSDSPIFLFQNLNPLPLPSSNNICRTHDQSRAFLVGFFRPTLSPREEFSWAKK